jgi:hypothetical protein
MMIARRLGGGDETYYTYVEEPACAGLRADDDPNMRRGSLPTKVALDLEFGIIPYWIWDRYDE